MKLIIGPPGTGKTTRLLDILEEEVKQTDPRRVAFCSFTKKAVIEAVERVKARFSFKDSDLPYFRTLHSLGFAMMNFKRSEVMQTSDFTKIGNHLGLKFTSCYDSADVIAGRNPGDRYRFIEGYAKARCLTPKSVWDGMDAGNLNWFEFLRYLHTLSEYKQKFNKVDYSDMLEMCNRALDIDVVIIDEAQDLSTLQWQFISRVFANAKRTYIAGDDDQAIYQWSGADVNYFVDLKGDREVLTQSHRVPKAVHSFAIDITDRIKYRTEKKYNPMDKLGKVDYYMDTSQVDMSEGTWLVLGRNNHYMNELAKVVRDKGHAFAVKGRPAVNIEHLAAIRLWEKYRKGYEIDKNESETIRVFIKEKVWDTGKIWHEAFTNMPWDDKEYYISLLRRGESITKAPRININTIHGVKGSEADHVVLLTDMTMGTWEGQRLEQDAEHRVWYVGATRCKESLHIIMPKGRYHYEI